jgi:ferredoxin
MPKINFLKEGIEIEAPVGANLRRVALQNGISVYPPLNRWLNCHGLGSCGTCRVLLKNGTAANATPAGWWERLRLSLSFFAIGHEAEIRLACRTKIRGDLAVETRPPFNWSGQTEHWKKPWTPPQGVGN